MKEAKIEAKETSVDPRTIDISKVKSSYTGRQGCCCGCRGTHTENRGAIKANLSRMIARSDGGRKVRDIGGCYVQEYGERIAILYLN